MVQDRQICYLDCAAMNTVHILDYVAGNVRSLVNAIEKVGYTVQWIKNPEDVQHAEVRDQANYSPKHAVSRAQLTGPTPETDPAWRRPFWSLSVTVLPEWLS